MTLDELRLRFPRASDDFIRLNSSPMNEHSIASLHEAYLRTGSVRRAAIEFGICGETLRKCLIASGIKLNRPKWNNHEVESLKRAYASADGLNLPYVAITLNRTYAAVACKADELGLCGERGKQIRTVAALQNYSAAQKRIGCRPEIVAQRSASTIAYQKKHGHPRGFLGHKRTPEELSKMKAGSAKAWSDPSHRVNSQEYRQRLSDCFSKAASTRKPGNAFSRAKYGVRPDVGSMFFRSSWEANYARYLNFLIANEGLIERWEYEPETFWFDKIKRGCRSYKPDFKVFLRNGKVEYHEVKGWMYPRAKTALKRMTKYHPSVIISLIDAARYGAIAKQCKKLIEGWE